MLEIKVLGWTIAAPFFLRRKIFSPVPKADARKDIHRFVERADRVILFKVFGKLLFRTRCLKRTYVLYRLFRENGHDAVAYIGFNKSGAGHAWLVVDGIRVEDPVFTPAVEFTPFVEIGDAVRALKGL